LGKRYLREDERSAERRQRGKREQEKRERERESIGIYKIGESSVKNSTFVFSSQI